MLPHLYLISFSVFYGVMLSLCRGLHAFDSSSAFKGERKAFARILVSISLINVIPFSYFAITFIYFVMPLPLNIFSVFVVLGLSLSVFGFYKILYGVLVGFKRRLYNELNEDNVKGYYPYDSDRKIMTEFDRHPMHHLVPGALYIFIPLGLLAFYYSLMAAIVLLAILFGSVIAVSKVALGK